MIDNDPVAKKTLMNSLNTLEARVNALEDLSNLSYKLLKKFTNPIPENEISIKKDNVKVETKNPVDENLIDLFNDNIERLGFLMNQIEGNIRGTIDFIE